MKTYLTSFSFPGKCGEKNAIDLGGRNCYDNFYPFFTLPEELRNIEFSPITILYGGNGSGKSTILNVIAEALNIRRTVKFNKTHFFGQYVNACTAHISEEPDALKIITSDDVFKRLFHTRQKSDETEDRREELLDVYTVYGKGEGRIRDIVGNGSWLENYDKLKDVMNARKNGMTGSGLVRHYNIKSIIGKSNGEEALEFFMSEVRDPGIYLLDEPENSLSAIFQRQLSEFLFESARFYDAQLVIATHSPFMLSIPGAKIYNLDSSPVNVTNDWTSLSNMREYYELFKAYSDDFER